MSDPPEPASASSEAPLQRQAPGSSPMPGLEGHWQRLHPLSPIVRAGRGAIALLIIVVVPAYASRSGSSGQLEHLGILALVLVLALISWLVTRWRVEAGVLRVDTGLIRRSSERFPLTQIQAIDIVRPGLARVFGLAELRIRLASGGRAAGRLAYLTSTDAETLRAHLLAMGHGSAEVAPAQAPPEHVLVTVAPGMLLASLALTGGGLLVELVICALVVLAVVAPGTAAAAVSAGTVWLLLLAVATFRRFNAGYRLTVADAHDGLRVRSGLVETAAETIPRGRIQAIRMTEPLLWRTFGWCRLDVDVASQKPKGRQDRDATSAVRSLLPVGRRSQAEALVARVFPELPSERLPPPRRVRWKSPLRYRWLSWGANDAYAVTTSGRLRRVTDLVPLSKVQSVRWVEGPLQRALQLASIHLDTAGRNVHAELRDRDRVEAAALLQELPERCRAARTREALEHPRRRPLPPVRAAS